MVGVLGSSNLSSNNIVLDSTNNSIDITTTNVSIEISNRFITTVGTSGLSNSDSLISENFVHQVLTLLHLVEEQIHL